MVSIACYAANEKKAMHKETKWTTIKWKLVTRVIKIVERKEVLEVSLKEMMLQQKSRNFFNKSLEKCVIQLAPLEFSEGGGGSRVPPGAVERSSGKL